MIQKFKKQISITFESNNDDNLFKKNFIKLLQCDFFKSFEPINIFLSSNSCKVISKKYDKIMVLSKIVFSQKYTLNDFILDVSFMFFFFIFV